MRTAYLAAICLLASPALADDYPPGPGTPGILTTDGVPATGTWEIPGDVDAFQANLVADGRAFAFTLQGDCHDKAVELYDAGFRMLRAPRVQARPDQGIVIEWRPGYTGTYYVVVSDRPLPAEYACPVAASDTYSLTANETCSPWTGTRCSMDDAERKPGTLRGTGDRNWFKFHVRPEPAGQRSKQVIMLSAYFQYNDMADPVVTLRAANGAWLNDSTQPKSRWCRHGDYNIPGDHGVCFYASLCPGTYFVAVRDDGISRPTRVQAGVYRDEYEQPGTCPR